MLGSASVSSPFHRPQHKHKIMRIAFVGEPGIDAGGLEREWFTTLFQRLADESMGLFQLSGHGVCSLMCHGFVRLSVCLFATRVTGLCSPPFLLSGGGYQINPLSEKCIDSHLQYFNAVGRLLGRAMMSGQTLPMRFSLTLLKVSEWREGYYREGVGRGHEGRCIDEIWLHAMCCKVLSSGLGRTRSADVV